MPKARKEKRANKNARDRKDKKVLKGSKLTSQGEKLGTTNVVSTAQLDSDSSPEQSGRENPEKAVTKEKNPYGTNMEAKTTNKKGRRRRIRRAKGRGVRRPWSTDSLKYFTQLDFCARRRSEEKRLKVSD